MTREEAAILLKAELATMTFTEETKDRIQALYMAVKALEELPKRRKEAKRWKTKALQAEPVKHGEWIYDGKKIKGGIEWVHCSNCGQKGDAKSILMKHGNYCPYCGAKMDKE